MLQSRSIIPLGLAAAGAAAFAIPHDAPAGPSRANSARAAAGEDARAKIAAPAPRPDEGPAALQAMLARYDRTQPGPARDRLALEVDAFAGQRYATVSRLYWYRDLTAAQNAARSLGRPILALRMLGRLDEDLSCANSRFFRTTLYANAHVSKLLRDHFVLYWSSERPVPRVTIDYGDGRKIQRTTTGNSAHYVLDADGRVIDVLPGLYAPAVFAAELTKSAWLEYNVRKLDKSRRTKALAEHHRVELQASSARLQSIAGPPFAGGRGRQPGRREPDASALARAQRGTMSKAMVEMPDLGKMGFDAGTISPGDVSSWAVIGQKLWGIYAAAAPRQRQAPTVLDAQSRALVAWVHNAGPVKAKPAELDAMIARLEQSIVADTALNELRLRPQIHQMLWLGEHSLEKLNEWLYTNVFQTPRADAWLGLLPRTDFTGLPGDGVVMP